MHNRPCPSVDVLLHASRPATANTTPSPSANSTIRHNRVPRGEATRATIDGPQAGVSGWGGSGGVCGVLELDRLLSWAHGR